MTQKEHEDRRKELDEDLSRGIRLLEAGHRAEVEALERAWTAGKPLPAPTPAAPRPTPESEKPKRRPQYELYDAIVRVLESLPELFTKDDLGLALGEVPDRRAILRAMRILHDNGLLAVESPGSGRTPTVYRRQTAK